MSVRIRNNNEKTFYQMIKKYSSCYKFTMMWKTFSVKYIWFWFYEVFITMQYIIKQSSGKL